MVKYIGRYTHSTAISNNRIISVEDDIVSFWFKNTRNKSRWETTTLPAIEFLNRFLSHVLPKHFHWIRYYGFLANGKAGKLISSIRQDLQSRVKPGSKPEELNGQACKCPVCGNGTMMTFLILDGYGNVVKEVQPEAEDVPALTAAGPL